MQVITKAVHYLQLGWFSLLTWERIGQRKVRDHSWSSSTEDFYNTDWVLKKEDGVAGDSLFYLDKLERNNEEEARKERERRVMQEGRWV